MPLSYFWRFLWRLGRWRLIRQRGAQATPLLPMIVVGALRMGGGGKTPFCAALARKYARGDARVGVLAYAVHGRLRADYMEVSPDSPWRASSEEAVWLARQGGFRVFVTRDRWKAWNRLSADGSLDVLISDDGWEDPRLGGAQRWLLDWGEPGISAKELFPAGRLRSLRSDHEIHKVIPMPVGVRWAWRYPENSRGARCTDPLFLVTAIGDPERLLADLRHLKIALAGQKILRDHSPRVASAVRNALKKHPAVLLTEKDAVKLPQHLRMDPRVYVIFLRLEID